MQIPTKQFRTTVLSSEQPTPLRQLSHLHCWETGKPAARGPWDSGRTVRNDGMSHEKTTDVSARSRWNLLTVGIWVESAAWVSVPGCHCPARHSRLSPLPRICLETSLLMDKMNFSQIPQPQKHLGFLSSENVWESESHALSRNCSCWLQRDELWKKKSLLVLNWEKFHTSAFICHTIDLLFVLFPIWKASSITFRFSVLQFFCLQTLQRCKCLESYWACSS